MEKSCDHLRERKTKCAVTPFNFPSGKIQVLYPHLEISYLSDNITLIPLLKKFWWSRILQLLRVLGGWLTLQASACFVGCFLINQLLCFFSPGHEFFFRYLVSHNKILAGNETTTETNSSRITSSSSDPAGGPAVRPPVCPSLSAHHVTDSVLGNSAIFSLS